MRTLGWVLTLLVFVPGLCGLVPVLERSPLFEIREILVEGCDRVNPETVRALLREEEGASLLALSSARVARKLEAHAPVGNASVIKRFPHALLVRIRERTPVALVEIQGTLCALDDQGVLLYPLEPGASPDLPLITGRLDGSWVPGRPNMGPAVQGALSLLGALDRTGLAARVREIRTDPEEGITFFLEGFSLEIRAGWEDFPARLALLAEVLPVLARDGHGFVDLRFRDQIVVGEGIPAHERGFLQDHAARCGTGAPEARRQEGGPPRG